MATSGALAILASATVSAGPSHAAPTRPGSTTPPKDGAVNYTWPRMAYSPSNSSVSADPAISSTNAPSLGVKWMAANGSAVMSSPVSGYSTALGRNVLFQGTEGGAINAFDANTGQELWSDNLGSAIRDTPLVEGNYVWVSPTYKPAMYKIDMATGQIACSTPMISTNNASATIGTPPGGQPSIYVSELDYGVSNGPLYSIDEATCAVNWTFTAYPTSLPADPLGAWDAIAFATDATGRALVVLGTSNPGQVDAVNAATGQLVWDFTTLAVSPTSTENDVGAGVTITPPGVNGFTDGMAYVAEEGGYMYAADLTTGAVVWTNHIAANFNLPVPFSRSTAAVVGSELIFGTSTGVLCLSAIDGSPIWNWNDGVDGDPVTETLGGVAVVGPPGSQVVATDDLAGGFNVLDVTTGSLLYHFQMGGFAVQSVSDDNGNLVTAASNGFDYDFALGGSVSGPPSTTVTAPANATKITNPNGVLTVSGQAGNGPISSVDVAIQSGGTSGPYWNAVTQTWTPGFFQNPATLSTPGGTSTAWTLQFPVPASGGVYEVQAAANGSNGMADTSAYGPGSSPAKASFTVAHLAGAPFLTTTQGSYVAPGQAIAVGGAGFLPGESVAISLEGTTLMTVTAGPSGGFATASVPIPASAAFGPAVLVGAGSTSGKQASAPIDVSNQWLSAGGGSLGQGFEPNDITLSRHISPSLSQFMALGWTYSASSGIHTSPAVLRSSLFFGDDAGNVRSLDIHSGAPQWTYNAGAEVDSSPAVGGGLVIFGVDTPAGGPGRVVALSSTTGQVAWSFQTTSPVESAPQVANGIVFAGSDDGTVYALHVATGQLLWQADVGGSVTSSPAVDVPARTVVVTDMSGKVTAFNSSTGSILWTVTTGGAVSASPSIYNGSVYVGSGDGQVYSLAERSGAVQWTFAAGSPVTASGCLYKAGAAAYQSYVVGTRSGAMDYVSLQNGQLGHQYVGQDPIVGVTCAVQFAVFQTAGGRAIGAKYPSQYSWVYSAPMGFATGGAIVNGVVYLTGLDQTVDAFTVPGSAIP